MCVVRFEELGERSGVQNALAKRRRLHVRASGALPQGELCPRRDDGPRDSALLGHVLQLRVLPHPREADPGRLDRNQGRQRRPPVLLVRLGAVRSESCCHLRRDVGSHHRRLLSNLARHWNSRWQA